MLMKVVRHFVFAVELLVITALLMCAILLEGLVFSFVGVSIIVISAVERVTIRQSILINSRLHSLERRAKHLLKTLWCVVKSIVKHLLNTSLRRSFKN